MPTYRVLIFLICSGLVSGSAYAQRRVARIDSLFQQLAREGHFNGGVLVAEKGRILYQRAFGYADLPTRTPTTLSSRFQLASIAKTFTSTAVLQLLEQNKIKLSDPLARYLPAFPYPTVTLRHLLSHTSGLPDLELYEPLVRQHPERLVTNQDIIPALRAWPRGLYFTPGTQWQYCNTNYILLALLVEKVSQQAFATYLQRHLFQPAGMRDTYLRMAGSPADARLVANHLLPTMYSTVPEPVETLHLQDSVRLWHLRFESRGLTGLYGPGQVVSTLQDLLRFDQALARGKLLRPRTIALAATPVKLNDSTTVVGGNTVDFGGPTSYGLGWVVRPDPVGGTIVGHDGYNRGIATMLYRNVGKGQTVIMYDNTEGEQFREKVAAVIALLNQRSGRPLTYKKSVARWYGDALRKQGPVRALVQFNTMRADTSHFYLAEDELNSLGYALLVNGSPSLALDAFQLNTVLFPLSFNVYDSYGDAFRYVNRRAEAIVMYQRALALNPNSEGTKHSLQLLQAPAP
ncbi:serine hydrolase domain-containing protein [Hymenobacter volaticus]|uniref:Beta-lactamase family protein n=1 Tax=Hymenobacter volaticus TaxID=2932254 RepID=A0ABY4GE52_9BACT|nr:serine hydrolase domain-containing protein [Hymenobacter volaticus]UOQ69205.1 beta-lactamase family protein [Hymenobacter volaticus]